MKTFSYVSGNKREIEIHSESYRYLLKRNVAKMLPVMKEGITNAKQKRI